MENQLSSSGIFHRIYLIADSQEDPKDLQDRNIEPEHVEGRIIFMSTFNDIGWTKKGNEVKCISNSEKSQSICGKVQIAQVEAKAYRWNGQRCVVWAYQNLGEEEVRYRVDARREKSCEASGDEMGGV